MDLASGICLVGQVTDQRWHFEQAKHRNADAIGGRDQVTGDHHREQPQVQRQMPQLGGHAGECPMVGRRRWRRADEAPEHTQQHHRQQHQADAFVQIWARFAPRAVVVQTDHPQAQAKQTEDCQGHTPVHDDADQAIARR
ncbi:hypothetical protein D3C76_1025760 [compost metagenome]